MEENHNKLCLKLRCNKYVEERMELSKTTVEHGGGCIMVGMLDSIR